MNYGIAIEDANVKPMPEQERFGGLVNEIAEVLRKDFPHDKQVDFVFALRTKLADNREEEINHMQKSILDLETEHKRLSDLINIAQKGNSILRG